MAEDRDERAYRALRIKRETYAGRARQDMSRVVLVPEYSAIAVGGLLLFVLAATCVAGALVLLGQASEYGVTRVVEALVLASYAVLLAFIGAVGLAVRDMARNSFRLHSVEQAEYDELQRGIAAYKVDHPDEP